MTEPAVTCANECCQTCAIRNQRGLHARAAAKFVKVVAAYDAEIEVTRGDVTVSGASIMGLMMLAAGPGTSIVIRGYGRDAELAVTALADLVGRGFDEA